MLTLDSQMLLSVKKLMDFKGSEIREGKSSLSLVDQIKLEMLGLELTIFKSALGLAYLVALERLERMWLNLSNAAQGLTHS